MLNKEVVSRIVNDLRTITKDEHISQRYVLSVASAKARFAMANRLHLSELVRLEDLYKTVRCLRMLPDNIVKCDVVEFRRCGSLMRSAKKLPDLFSSKLGVLIVSVTSIDGLKRFERTTPQRFLEYNKRSFASKFQQNFYYIKDGYLYLPDSEIEAVDIVVVGFSENEVESLSECSDSKTPNIECKSPLDEKFVCPDKLLDMVISEASNEIAAKFRKISPDENPNLDENIKTRSTN